MDVTALAAENRSLRETNAVLVEKLQALSLELARLKRQVIGPKSERRVAPAEAQVPLLAPLTLDEADAAPPAPPPPRVPAAAPHGRRAPDGEPDEVLAAAAPDACSTCGGSLRLISTTTATRVDWRRGHFVRIQIRRPSCTCDRCRTVETAPEPAGFALPRSIAANGLVAHIVIDKFADNIPLNRQVTRFAREGLEIGLSTLCDLVRATAGLFRPVVATMRREQLAGTWLQADDTGLPVLDGSKGQTGTGRLWVYANDRHVVYDFTPTKHGTGPAAYVDGFHGVLLADGGSEFNEAIRRQGLVRAGCWSHARRYFFDAREQSPALADDAIQRIGILFEIERALAGADLETRRRTRVTDTKIAIEGVHAWLVEHVHHLRPKSPLGQAVQYALHQWPFLEVCVTHPEIPIHNNLSELQLRRPVVGRKNWLFAGSEGGAASAATLFSLIGSCQLHHLDPWTYLNDLLGRINDHSVRRLGELTPAAVAGK